MEKIMNDMICGVYYYWDKKKEEIIYIGKSVDCKSRDKEHRRRSKYNDQPFNRIIQKNPKRYEFNILLECEERELNSEEMNAIKKYNPKFNFTEGGEGSTGYKHSPEIRKKLSQLKKGRFTGSDNPMFGKTHSEETKRKISLKNSGKNNYFYGKHHSEETKRKISEAQLGPKNHMYGKHPSKETLEKMSKVKLGKNNSFYGKHHTKETKMKIGRVNRKNENNTKFAEIRKCKESNKLGYRFMYYKNGKTFKKSIYFDKVVKWAKNNDMPLTPMDDKI